jgi:hypothetical protein
MSKTLFTFNYQHEEGFQEDNIEVSYKTKAYMADEVIEQFLRFLYSCGFEADSIMDAVADYAKDEKPVEVVDYKQMYMHVLKISELKTIEIDKLTLLLKAGGYGED